MGCVHDVFGILVALSACARGALDGAEADVMGDDAAAPAIDAAPGVPPPDAGAPGVDATVTDAQPPPVDAPPASLGVGQPCAADAQCATSACVLVHADAAAAALCTQTCGLFETCPLGTSCYDDGTLRACVLACPDASPCPAGLTCRPTYPPEVACLPGP